MPAHWGSLAAISPDIWLQPSKNEGCPSTVSPARPPGPSANLCILLAGFIYLVASLRCLDTFVKFEGAWLFAERLLYVDWLDEGALS
jgi:hypothetical protein